MYLYSSTSKSILHTPRLLLRNPKLFRTALLTISIVSILHILFPRHRLHSSGLIPQNHCPDDALANSIVIAVKTGASEASEKIPPLMRTSLQCAKNVLFFSDLEQDLGPYHLHDALATISPEVKSQDTAFEFYRLQQEAWLRDGNVNSTKGMRDPNSPTDLAAWTLDKYKNTHILEKTWALVPDKEWYILIDADTYIIYSNFLHWLPSLDSAKKMFLGSAAFIGGRAFAHGGSGTVFSKNLMYDFAVTHNGTAAEWDSKIHSSCCGDAMLAEVLKEYENDFISMKPVISGHKPGTIPYYSDYWCHPTLSMHHFNKDDMEAVQKLERSRTSTSIPLVYADIFEALVKDDLLSMPAIKGDWDNYSYMADMGSGILGEGKKESATQTVEECATVCEAEPECVQFVFDGESCFWGKAIRLGEKKEPADGKHWQSGWNQTRVAEWISRQKPCDSVSFPDYNTQSHF